MSDTQQGPESWQASDGKWYAPQAQGSGGALPPPPQKKKGGCLKVGLILLGVLVVLGIIGGVLVSMAADEVVEDLESATENKAVDPSNPDTEREDQNVAIGDTVELSGYTTAVKSANFQGAISEFEEDGYLVADVAIANRDDEAQPFNYFDFKLQTPGGQVIDPTFASTDGLLQSGDLIKGGSVTGKVIWEVGAAKGDYFVIYKPDAFNAARGLWKVTI